MLKTFALYIGADNKTHKVNRPELLKVLDKHYEGYTVAPAQGCWRGQREESVVVTVQSEDTVLGDIINEIKYKLKQEAVGYQEVSPLLFA